SPIRPEDYRSFIFLIENDIISHRRNLNRTRVAKLKSGSCLMTAYCRLPDQIFRIDLDPVIISICHGNRISKRSIDIARIVKLIMLGAESGNSAKAIAARSE